MFDNMFDAIEREIVQNEKEVNKSICVNEKKVYNSDCRNEVNSNFGNDPMLEALEDLRKVEHLDSFDL